MLGCFPGGLPFYLWPMLAGFSLFVSPNLRCASEAICHMENWIVCTMFEPRRKWSSLVADPVLMTSIPVQLLAATADHVRFKYAAPSDLLSLMSLLLSYRTVLVMSLIPIEEFLLSYRSGCLMWLRGRMIETRPKELSFQYSQPWNVCCYHLLWQ